jgi:hypothetical protein
MTSPIQSSQVLTTPMDSSNRSDSQNSQNMVECPVCMVVRRTNAMPPEFMPTSCCQQELCCCCVLQIAQGTTRCPYCRNTQSGIPQLHQRAPSPSSFRRSRADVDPNMFGYPGQQVYRYVDRLFPELLQIDQSVQPVVQDAKQSPFVSDVVISPSFEYQGLTLDYTGVVNTVVKMQISIDTIPSRDTVIIIDKSGSMEGEKIRRAQQTAKYLIDNCVGRLGIIVFNHQSTRLSHLQVLNDENRIKMRRLVDNIMADGCTDLILPLQDAFAMIQERKDTSRSCVIYYTTDGQGNFPSAEMMQTLPPNTIVNTIGIGTDHDIRMKSISDACGPGSYAYVENDTTMPQVLSRMEGSPCAALNVQLQFDTPNMTLVDTFRCVDRIYHLPTLNFNSPLAITCHTLISLPHDQFLVSGTLTYTNTQTGLVQTQRVQVLMPPHLDVLPERNLDVVESVIRCSVLQQIEQARVSGTQHNLGDARRILQEALTQLQSSPVASRAVIQCLITTIQDLQRQYVNQRSFDYGGLALTAMASYEMGAQRSVSDRATSDVFVTGYQALQYTRSNNY